VWPDVEDTLRALHEKLTRDLRCSVRCMAFSGGLGSKFPRPDLVQSLRRAGVPAQDAGVSASALAVARRNLLGLIKTKLVELLPDERAAYQIKQLKPGRTQLVPTPGIASYLAEARILCLAGAAPLAGAQTSGSISVFTPHGGRNSEAALWKKAPLLGLVGQKPKEDLERFS